MGSNRILLSYLLLIFSKTPLSCPTPGINKDLAGVRLVGMKTTLVPAGVNLMVIKSYTAEERRLDMVN